MPREESTGKSPPGRVAREVRSGSGATTPASPPSTDWFCLRKNDAIVTSIATVALTLGVERQRTPGESVAAPLRREVPIFTHPPRRALS